MGHGFSISNAVHIRKKLKIEFIPKKQCEHKDQTIKSPIQIENTIMIPTPIKGESKRTLWS
tara:strand:- start:22178 stop:22360 length:183 start_codon:yes stop_codon:yes gene_type:complete